MPIQAFLRFAAVASPITVAAMSWLPLAAMVETGISQPLEHVLAYFGSGALVKGAWPRLRAATLLAAFAAMAAVLEIGQIWMPGRSAQFDDFAFGLLGSALALTLGPVMAALGIHGLPPAGPRHSDMVSEGRAASAYPASLVQFGLLSLLMTGGLLSVAWIASLIWGAYLVARWLLD